MQVGSQHVVCIITDSAPVNRAAAKELEIDYPHIMFPKCSAHAVNLMLKDIGKLDWVDPIIKTAKEIVKFLRAHHKTLKLTREAAKELPIESVGHGKELLLPGDTRFGTQVIMAGRLLELKEAVIEVVNSTAFKDWYGTKGPDKRASAKDVKASCNCATFWQNLKALVNLLTPFVSMLRLVDTVNPVMGKVYHGFAQLDEHIQKFNFGQGGEAKHDEVMNKFQRR